MIMLSMIASGISLMTGTYSAVETFISIHGYAAIVVLMALESASLPIPSEVILPLTGHFIATGLLNPYIALIATMIGTTIGISIDYGIAYLLEKEVVYKHMHIFHIKRSEIDGFDRWFKDNGPFAVFVSRLLPVVRGLISFPAGFARMPLKRFYFYSLTASLVWNVALITVGYYVLSIANAELLFGAIAVFAIALYIIYTVAMRRIRKA